MLKSVSSSLGLLALTALISGCTAIVPTHVVADIDGDGIISPGEQVLAAYSPTLADSAAPASITAAMQQPDGIEGYGFGTTPTSAAATAGTFQTATVSLNANKSIMTVKVGGQTYTIPASVSSPIQTVDINGTQFNAYNFGEPFSPTSTTPAHAGSTLNTQYASATIFIKDQVFINGAQSNNGYVMFTTGLETPLTNIPTQLATYQGKHLALSDNASNSSLSDFSADVDFNSSSITGRFDNSLTIFSGTISGNNFSGSTAPNLGPGITGTIIGAFYGPHADEIGGVTSGTRQGVDVNGVFVGVKN